MRWGIYGDPYPDRGLPVCWALGEGVKAIGHRLLFRSPKPFRADQVESVFDVIATHGWARARRLLIEAYAKQGIPGLVLELGHLKRGVLGRDRIENGYFQMSLNRLNWLPPMPCPGDRFRKLKLRRASKPRTGGQYILLAGQKPGDNQHTLADLAAVKRWALAKIEEIRRHTDRPIRWRPHPFAQSIMEDLASLPGVEVSDPNKVSLTEDLKNAHALVTLNSASAQEALLAGVPVFCDPCAIYAEVANLDLARIEDPEWRDTEDYFNRLAYSIWNMEELKTGAWADFYLPLIEEFRAAGGRDAVLHE